MSGTRAVEVTPGELRELAARARAFAVEVDAAQARLGAAADEPTRRVGFRLDEAASSVRGAGRGLEATADDLDRIRGRSACLMDWGVCPEHGATLRSSGVRCWCTVPGCGREWDHDRLGLPYTEPVAFDVRDAAGAGGPMCAGHAADAGRRLIGARVTALPADGGRP